MLLSQSDNGVHSYKLFTGVTGTSDVEISLEDRPLLGALLELHELSVDEFSQLFKIVVR